MASPQSTSEVLEDQEARDRAIDPQGSFIVQAPAGSGKTSILVSRYLELLKVVERPEQILAITFTKKAAAEMRDRILSALAADTPLARALAERNTQLGWSLESNPNRLKIQTIDSFALELCSRAADIEEGVPNEILERADLQYRQAADRLLDKLIHDDELAPLIAEFVAHLDNDALLTRRLLMDMLARRDQWLDLAVAVHQDPHQIEAHLSASISALRKRHCDHLARGLTHGDLTQLEMLADQIGLAADADVYWWQPLVPYLLTKQGKLKKRVTVRDELGDVELRRALTAWLTGVHERGLAGRFEVFHSLPKDALSAEQMNFLTIVCINLSLVAIELDQVFKASDCIDFTGLLLSAQRALRERDGSPTDLAFYLDHRINHVLIDEFQDTSRSQLHLFNLLLECWEQSESNTVFAVGDPMQSIYRFRNADVRIFAETKTTGIAEHSLEPLNLTSNFRSDPVLVEWCNSLFEDLFGREANDTFDAVRFTPATPKRPGSEHPDRQGEARVIAHANEEDEIAFITASISQLLEDTDGSIAVLCRAKTHVSGIFKSLEDNQIAWQATEMQPLATQPVIRDLFALTTTLLAPDNRLAWMSLLRSPMFGVELTALTRLGQATFPDNLANSSDSRIQRLSEAVSWAREQLNNLTLREVVEGYWLRCGAELAYPSDVMPHARAFLSLTDDHMSLDDIRDAMDNLHLEAPQQARVQIMTMHKAKGLEFDHVILPMVHRRTRGDDAELLSWQPDVDGLLLGVRGDDVHRWLKFTSRQAAQDEEKRLLYVACTRAKKSLTITYTDTDTGKTTGLARLLEDRSINAERLPPSTPDQHALDIQADLFSDAQLLERIAADFRWSPPPYDPLLINDVTQAPKDVAGQLREVAIGSLIHKALCWLSQNPALYTETEIIPRLQLWSSDLLAQDRDTITTTALEHIERVINSETGRWILAAHTHHVSEHPLSAYVNNNLTNIVIDRMFVDQGLRWIIDYKSQVGSGRDHLEYDRAGLIARSRAQLEKYAEIVSELHDEPVRAAIFVTNSAELIEIR